MAENNAAGRASEWAGEVNMEQEDPGQAQEVAEEALQEALAEPAGNPALESRRAAAREADEPPDVIEQMQGMIDSGVIDYDAYVGEPRHDDEDENYGDVQERDAGEEEPLDAVAGESDPLGEVASEGDGDGEEPLADL